MDALEQILFLFTCKKEEINKNTQEDVGQFLKIYENCKKRFNKTKNKLNKSSSNYDLPLQSSSNETSNSSSIKREVLDIKPEIYTESPQNIANNLTNNHVKIDTSNNLIYTPSNFESLSFYDNLKESKNSKKT